MERKTHYRDRVRFTLKMKKDYTVLSPSMGLRKLVDFCNELDKWEIPCEVIAYDIHPMTTAFDYPVEFLGIDIVHEMSESLICECNDRHIIQMLNENGLCDVPMTVNYIVPLLDHGDVKWEPCYVYKVINLRTGQGDG